MHRSLLALLVATACLGVACGSSDDDAGGQKAPDPTGKPADPAGNGTTPPTLEEQLAEKPWEVVSNKGETYLPNVFYADASQNEQIMPWAIDGHTMIDRLVYPTLGNPNLYTKGDAKDELVVVLRLEDSAFDYLEASKTAAAEKGLTKLSVGNDPKTGFAFFLVPRGSRENNTEANRAISSGNGTDIYRIYPNEALLSPQPADMPAVLKERKTVRFVFRQNAMAKVPAGLYDLRFESRRDNDLYKSKGSAVYEYQYNAVRVFDTEPEEGAVLNVTDTQVSVGSSFQAGTKQKLDELVNFVNTTNDADVRKAAFITFNGDLHNGGSPRSLLQRTVATTYNQEAKAIVDALKYLPMPIFLTIGNHDGYVATGHVPSAIKAADSAVGESLQEVIEEQKAKPWPGFSYTEYQAFLDASEKADRLGGFHKDLFVGSFARTTKGTFGEGWQEVPRKDRNFILYDGFHQWQKTYGPLYYSHRFGSSFYVSMNSFELRQHRRSGWGMYTVNYGGGMSDVQMQWVDREILRSKTDNTELVLLAHHDPRGGHASLDQGYFFEQLEYKSIYQSAINYLWQVEINGSCKLPAWALPRDAKENCAHDGLQEWMRPDEELDCAPSERKNGVCDPALFDPKNNSGKSYWFSGVELMKRIAENTHVRTVILGHTHYNQLEVMGGGDQLLPGKLDLAGTRNGASLALEFATIEVQNPMRGYVNAQTSPDTMKLGSPSHVRALFPDYEPAQVAVDAVLAKNVRFAELYEKRTDGMPRFLDAPAGAPRELVILRLVSNADLAEQTYNGKSAMGFSVLHRTKKVDARMAPNAQINRITFFVNTGSNLFTKVKTIDVDRQKRLKPHDPQNPVEQIYDW